MKSLDNDLQQSQLTDDASVADGREKSHSIERVQDIPTLQNLMPFITHSEELQRYVLARWRDPNTLILRYERSVVVASVLEHDFFGGKICVLVWAQNPDHFPVRIGMGIVEEWARERGASRLVAFMDESGPWQRLKAYMRLTGLKPFRMCFAKEL
jgi:hypothetical protein